MYSPLVQGGTVCKWANDGQRFILEYLDTICNYPSPMYDSALPLSSSSWLHKYYTAELLQAPKMVKGPKSEWGACSHTVLWDSSPWVLSYWNNTIAVGFGNGDIIILDAITGSQTAVLSEHTGGVECLTFSSDGKSLASGSHDNTVKLWDIQTGGAIKSFYGHTGFVQSVSISADHTRIASGSDNREICLWDIQTGELLYTIEQEKAVDHVRFSPMNPQHIISISGCKVWHWDVNGHHIPPTYSGTDIAFSPDHTLFALCNGQVITVQNSDLRAIIAKFCVATYIVKCCCFSPDGRLIAAVGDNIIAASGNIIYVWDVASSNPHLIETFIGHTMTISSLKFSSPSSLISASYDKSVKFWQISTLSADPVTTDQ